MTGLREPLDRGLERSLRRAVLDHATAERRLHHPAVLHVGWPGEREVVVPADASDDGALDHTLCTDVVAAAVAGVSGREPAAPSQAPLVWLTRSGEMDLQDVDATWAAAASAAYAEAGLPLVMVVVNRRAWVDPRSGVGRTWLRLRRR